MKKCTINNTLKLYPSFYILSYSTQRWCKLYDESILRRTTYHQARTRNTQFRTTSRLSEERTTTTMTREPGNLQRSPTPIALDRITIEESPRKKDRKPLSTRVSSSSPDKLNGAELGKWNESAVEGGQTLHLRTSSLPRESRREDTPRRSSSSPDTHFWSLSSPKLSKNRSGNLSDSKVVESWTDEQQDFPPRSYSSGSSKSPTQFRLSELEGASKRTSLRSHLRVSPVKSYVGLTAQRKSDSEVFQEVKRRTRSASWGNVDDVTTPNNRERVSTVEKQIYTKDFERILQKRNLAEWKKRADRLSKSDDLNHYRDVLSSPPSANKRRSAPSSPNYEKDYSFSDNNHEADLSMDKINTAFENLGIHETHISDSKSPATEDSIRETYETVENLSDNSEDSMDEEAKSLSNVDSGLFSHNSIPEEPKLLSIIPSVEFELKSPSREDFIASELIGEGAYSKVLRATHKPTAKEYAVKVVSKQMARKLGQEGRLINEQDESFLYFVIEFCPYGDMNNLIKIARRKNRALTKDTIRFYAAELVSALEKVHKEGIIHRDVKPQNILIGDRGHLKLTDFGIAARIQSPNSNRDTGDFDSSLDSADRRNSFVGTFTYMAPELIREEGACFASDLWALGVILYQMFTGEVPFKGSSDYLLFQSILKGHVEFPKNFPSASGRDLIEKLLVTDVDMRLGAKGYDDLKNHSFFRGIRFEFLDKVDATKVLDIGNSSSQRNALKTVGKTIGSIFSVVGNVANLASLAEIWDSSKFGSVYEKELDDSNEMTTPLELYISHEKWRQSSRKVLNLAVEWTGNLVLRHPVEVAKDLLAREKSILEEADRDWALVPSDEYKEFLVAAAQLQSVSPSNLTDPERIAFWTTMYHVMFLHILKFLTPVTRALRNERFFRDAFYRIYTLDYCLDDIEYGMLGAGQKGRKPYFLPDDPRDTIRVQEVEPACFEMLHKIRVSRGFCESFYQ
ncbi:3-phosphoinositide-dependent protein kinase 1 [Galdieria sulphuraria]|nr:3-phosphoinositide-dependent protein kinase 1 [Galdieria sulphuraria]